ncbi:MAG: cytochrome-c oxidase, cbb3-type subunit III [Gammaproteobacteria bacterium]|nr:MAG: cytochrome-c oxidase, cbb3-type subunit III [Gammaproteobacteria bacterium]
MADFTSAFWEWFIIVPTVGGLVAMVVLIQWLTRGAGTPKGEKIKTMGHVWDEDLEELNNPLPLWWLGMFYITLALAAIYLVLYPGLGSFKGTLGWTQVKQYEAEMAEAKATYGPIFDRYSQLAIAEAAKEPQAIAIGERLFATYCSICHGSDARGGPGYPNLRDKDWLYGGEPETIETTILGGRNGMMPAWKAVLSTDGGIQKVTQYVLSLSGRATDKSKAEQGKALFQTYCVACHMPDGTGNKAMGAPNLTDNVWLYGGSAATIEATLLNGRQGRMPPHREFLGESKVHLLAAYVYSLSQ